MHAQRVCRDIAWKGLGLLFCGLLGGCMGNGPRTTFSVPSLYLADFQPSELPPSKQTTVKDTEVKLPPGLKATLLPPLLPPPRVLGGGQDAVPPPKGLTLADVIKESLQNDPRIHAAAENITQASADLWTASLVPNPTLTTSGTLLPLNRPFTVTEQGGPPQFDVGIGFPLAWLLWGQRSAAMNSARAGVDVSSADFADLVRQRVAGAVAAYYDVLEAKGLLALAKEDVDNLRRLEGITKDRVKLGGVGSIEEDRIRLSVLDGEREVKRREAAVVTTNAALQAQLGRLQVDPSFEVQGQLDVAVATAPPAFDQALSIAEQFRPDIVSLRLQVAKAEADWRQEQTKACPDVVPRFGLTRQFQRQAIGFPDASSYGAGLDVVLPLFDRNQGNIFKAQSVVQQIRYNLHAQQAQLRGDLSQTLEDFRVAYVAVSSDSPERLKAARSVRDRIESAYKAGGRPLIEVLDAQRAYRDTLRTFILDQSVYWHALHRLNATLGRQVLR